MRSIDLINSKFNENAFVTERSLYLRKSHEVRYFEFRIISAKNSYDQKYKQTNKQRLLKLKQRKSSRISWNNFADFDKFIGNRILFADFIKKKFADL